MFRRPLQRLRAPGPADLELTSWLPPGLPARLRFDESGESRNMHSTMKRLSCFLPLLLAALPVAAQMDTNAPDVPADTNAVVASPDTNTGTRAMSLQDCIQEALQHNLDVQIQRYNPQISLYNLRAAYGGYDPAFNISGKHNYNVSPSTL